MNQKWLRDNKLASGMLSLFSKFKHLPSLHDCSASLANVSGRLFVWSQGFPGDRCLKCDDTGVWEEERMREGQGERKILKKLQLQWTQYVRKMKWERNPPLPHTPPICFQTLIWESVRWDGSFGNRHAWPEEGDTRTRQITSFSFLVTYCTEVKVYSRLLICPCRHGV